MNRKTRVAGLLKRFQFVDLARFVAMDGDTRISELRKYVDRESGVFATYEPFRHCVGGIYGIQLGLDPSPASDWPTIEGAVRRACKGRDEGMNLEVSRALFDYLRVHEDNTSAYPHQERSLLLAPDRKCYFRLGHYLVRDDQLVFQFPYPRRTRLPDDELHVMMSLIHYGYAFGDFEGAAVEIVDLSCEQNRIRVEGRTLSAPRSPRTVSMPGGGPLGRGVLENEIQQVYTALLSLADEPQP